MAFVIPAPTIVDDVTLQSVAGVLSLKNGGISNAHVAAAAAIALTKLATPATLGAIVRAAAQGLEATSADVFTVADGNYQRVLANVVDQGHRAISVANDGAAAIVTGGTNGVVIVVDANGFTAVYNLKGGNNAVAEMLDPDDKFSVVKDTAGKTNIYFEAGYKIQNKTGTNPLNYRIFYSMYP